MNREILFRGKRKDNDEWVEGYYAKRSNYACFASELKYNHFILKDIMMDFNLGGLQEFEIIPETVGQYTGLTDKNGKKIFEGDIVSQNRNGFETLYVTIFTDKDVGSCGCCYPSFDGIGFVFESVKGTRANVFDLYPLEVVGNIHDNKEMLKVQ